MSQVLLAADHVLPPRPNLGLLLQAGEHYLTIRLATLQLEVGRDWFSEHLPLLSTHVQFSYGGVETGVPVAVGPSLVSAAGGPLPSRIDFQDTRLCPIAPYKGGDVTISTLLSRVSSEPKLTRLLGFVEAASRAMKTTAVLAAYAGVVDVVTGAIDEVVQNSEAPPSFGSQAAFSQDNGTLRSAVLVIAAADLDPSQVWLVDNEVRVGTDADSATALHSDHAVLIIERADDRSDAEALPVVTQLWPKVEQLAGHPDASSWETAKSWLSVLNQELYLSPDLVRPQAQRLYKKFVEDAVARHEEAKELKTYLGAGGEAEPEVLQVMKNIDDAVRAL